LGVDATRVRRHPELKTGLGVALAEPADRAILTCLGTIDAAEPAVLCAGLLGVFRHWHIASYFLLSKLRGCWPEWLRACKKAGLTTSLDTNWDPEERWAGVLELLPHVDVFFPNEAEALAISGESTVTRAGEKLAAFGPLVVVKRGSKGAVAFGRGACWAAEGLRARAAPIVDTIGAGDNFDAGFLRAWLLGRDVSDCLNLAQRCAVESLGAPGGIEGQLKENIS
jgi:ribokinase